MHLNKLEVRFLPTTNESMYGKHWLQEEKKRQEMEA